MSSKIQTQIRLWIMIKGSRVNRGHLLVLKIANVGIQANKIKVY